MKTEGRYGNIFPFTAIALWIKWVHVRVMHLCKRIKFTDDFRLGMSFVVVIFFYLIHRRLVSIYSYDFCISAAQRSSEFYSDVRYLSSNSLRSNLIFKLSSSLNNQIIN